MQRTQLASRLAVKKITPAAFRSTRAIGLVEKQKSTVVPVSRGRTPGLIRWSASATIEVEEERRGACCGEEGGGEVGEVRRAGEVDEDVVEEGVERYEHSQDDGDVAAVAGCDERADQHEAKRNQQGRDQGKQQPLYVGRGRRRRHAWRLDHRRRNQQPKGEIR